MHTRNIDDNQLPCYDRQIVISKDENYKRITMNNEANEGEKTGTRTDTAIVRCILAFKLVCDFFFSSQVVVSVSVSTIFIVVATNDILIGRNPRLIVQVHQIILWLYSKKTKRENNVQGTKIKIILTCLHNKAAELLYLSKCNHVICFFSFTFLLFSTKYHWVCACMCVCVFVCRLCSCFAVCSLHKISTALTILFFFFFFAFFKNFISKCNRVTTHCSNFSFLLVLLFPFCRFYFSSHVFMLLIGWYLLPVESRLRPPQKLSLWREWTTRMNNTHTHNKNKIETLKMLASFTVIGMKRGLAN